MPIPKAPLLSILLVSLAGCSLRSLPTEPPPLVKMDEPIALKTEPDDERARQALPLGAFSGVYAKSAYFEPPVEPGQTPDALEITEVVENSPGTAAGLVAGDLLLEVKVGDAAPVALAWPAQWRKLEAEVAPGTTLLLTIDRAGAERQAKLTLVPRLRHPSRLPVEIFRETDRAGIVVRTGTEVEARAAGLGAGGGAVLVGMSAQSPWRGAGMRYLDFIQSVDGEAIDDPQVLLGAIRTAAADAELRVKFTRDGEARECVIPTTRRAGKLTEVSWFGLFSYTADRDRSSTSILFGLFGYESTRAAWALQLLWFLNIKGGDSDVLEEVRR